MLWYVGFPLCLAVHSGKNNLELWSTFYDRIYLIQAIWTASADSVNETIIPRRSELQQMVPYTWRHSLVYIARMNIYEHLAFWRRWRRWRWWRLWRLLSTCWFQERIRAWFHNQTEKKLKALWKIDIDVK